MKINIAGENALIIYLGDQLNPATAAKVQHATHAIEAALGPLLIDLIPAYASILVLFDIFRTDHHSVRQLITQALTKTDVLAKSEESLAVTLIELPVYYSTESGPDLPRISDHNQLPIEHIIALHQAQEYRVYSIGFAPGFAYLGEVDARIATPRLTTPRRQVAKGSVAIADRQTAVYPAASPGGWNLIGLCPLNMFDPQAAKPMPLAVGDRIRFYAIDRDHFLKMGGQLPSELCNGGVQ